MWQKGEQHSRCEQPPTLLWTPGQTLERNVLFLITFQNWGLQTWRRMSESACECCKDTGSRNEHNTGESIQSWMGWYMPGYCARYLLSKPIAPCWLLEPQDGYSGIWHTGRQRESRRTSWFVSVISFQEGLKAAQISFPHKVSSTGVYWHGMHTSKFSFLCSWT